MFVDAHIHIFKPEHFDNLSWQTPKGPLYASHDISVYLPRVTPKVSGAVFIETDAKYQDPSVDVSDDEAWKFVLAEYEYFVTSARDTRRGIGIVPWAPIHLGSAVLQRYKAKLDQINHKLFSSNSKEWNGSLISGYRYLLQEKPNEMMQSDAFVDGLRWIRDQGVAFDLGIDVHRRGNEQLRYALEMLRQVKRDGKKEDLIVVINHFSKYDFNLSTSSNEFKEWKALLGQLATENPASYMKFSSAFNELPKLSQSETFPYDVVCGYVEPIAAVIFDIFGPERVVWASDWPVCNIGFKQILGGEDDGWHTWLKVSQMVVDSVIKKRREQEPGRKEDWSRIWGENAMKCYKLQAWSVATS